MNFLHGKVLVLNAISSSGIWSIFCQLNSTKASYIVPTFIPCSPPIVYKINVITTTKESGKFSLTFSQFILSIYLDALPYIASGFVETFCHLFVHFVSSFSLY